ncbi:MAG: serpin family protein [Hyphomonadaceae bacterium]
MSGAQLSAWLQRLGEAGRARLDLTLPKIEVRASYDLGQVLQAMGMRQAFTGAADFSGITQQEALAISAVIHKTFLAIDEEGTEAAAATAVDMVATAAPMNRRRRRSSSRPTGRTSSRSITSQAASVSSWGGSRRPAVKSRALRRSAP